MPCLWGKKVLLTSFLFEHTICSTCHMTAPLLSERWCPYREQGLPWAEGWQGYVTGSIFCQPGTHSTLGGDIWKEKLGVNTLASSSWDTVKEREHVFISLPLCVQMPPMLGVAKGSVQLQHCLQLGTYVWVILDSVLGSPLAQTSAL